MGAPWTPAQGGEIPAAPRPQGPGFWHAADASGWFFIPPTQPRPSLLARLRSRLARLAGRRPGAWQPLGMTTDAPEAFTLRPDGSGRVGPLNLGGPVCGHKSWRDGIDQEAREDQLLAGIFRRFIADPTAYVYAEDDARQVCLDGWADLSDEEEALLIRLNQQAKATRAAQEDQ